MTQPETLQEYRDYLFAIAYRMLGTRMGAEDMVQETYLRWQQVDPSEVDSPKSYLATIITRLCIDHLKSARMRREQYIGPWLPEPLISAPEDGPVESVAMAESLTTAFLVLMEALDPEQRAVYLLREVFDYSYAEIAEMVEKSEAACRQMVSRSRRYLRDRRPKHSVNRSQSEQAVRQFMNAINDGDLAGLMKTLDADVIWTSDGGGMRGVARKPISGRDKVARFILALAERAPTGISLRITWINGQPGMIITVEGEPYATLSLAIHEGRVASIWAVVNPDKMEHIRQNINS